MPRELDRFEIARLAQRRAATLSGGELRRLALARAFVLRPAMLLLDEPFDDLDAAGQASLSLELRRAIAVVLNWAGAELRTHLLAGRGLVRSLAPGAPVSLSVCPEHVHLIPAGPGSSEVR